MADIGLEQPGVANAVQFPGLSINGFANQPTPASSSSRSTPFEERTVQAALRPGHRHGALNQKFGGIQDAFVAVFPPPPVNGLGASAASSCSSRTAPASGDAELAKAAQALIGRAYQTPRAGRACSRATR